MAPDELTLQNHTPEGLEALSAFLERYRSVYPDAKLISAGFYTYHPALENGANAFCVVDGQGCLRGFAPLFPAPVGDEASPDDGIATGDPHHIWTILLADPTFDAAEQVRAALLDPLLARARTLAEGFPPGRATRLASDLMISQRDDIAFLEKNGFSRYEGTYMMRHSLSQPLSPGETRLEKGLTLRHSKLASEAERLQYLHAYNQAFPGSPKNLATLKFLLDSPLWSPADTANEGGTAIMACCGEELIASILTYPTEERPHAYTDDVFVLPAWRGRGIAKALIASGLAYAQAQGFSDILLEVKQSNQPAIAVYRAMGYETINQVVFLGLFLS